MEILLDHIGRSKNNKKNHGQKSFEISESDGQRFAFSPRGFLDFLVMGKLIHLFWYGIFPCSALESLALLGFVTRGPLCIGYRRSLNNAKDLGLQFCQVVGCLVVWWVGWLVGWWVVFHQPIWKICKWSSNWIISPGVTKEKNV